MASLGALKDDQVRSSLFAASAALQLCLCCFFLVISHRASSVERARIQALSAGATLIASFAALLQFAGFGTGESQWVRYADYAVATPLLVSQLHLLAESPASTTAFCALLQSMVILSGFAGSQLESNRLAFTMFTYGALLFCLQFALLFLSLWRLSIRAAKHDPSISPGKVRFLWRFFAATMLTWLLYPMWWVVLRVRVSNVRESSSLFNLIFDALCKGVLGFVLWVFSFRARRGQTSAILPGDVNAGSQVEAVGRQSDFQIAVSSCEDEVIDRANVHNTRQTSSSCGDEPDEYDSNESVAPETHVSQARLSQARLSAPLRRPPVLRAR